LNRTKEPTMYLAFSSLACPAWTVEETADAVARYGFDGIEWRLVDGDLITSQTAEVVLRRLVEATRTRGLRVAALDSSCQLVQLDAAGRAATAREGEFMVDLAVRLGAPTLRVFGGPLPEEVTLADALGPAADVLRSIARYAAPRGIRVLLETHDPAWSRSANALALLQTAAEPPVGILYDVLHPCRMGEDVEHTVATLGRHIELVHLKDGKRPTDGSTTWQLCALGEGNVPLATVLAALRAHGYDTWYTFEWEKRWHPELAEPEVALPQGAAYIRALAAAVLAPTQEGGLA
jgi:sugar phosphate isomerase/epimerase